MQCLHVTLNRRMKSFSLACYTAFAVKSFSFAKRYRMECYDDTLIRTLYSVTSWEWRKLFRTSKLPWGMYQKIYVGMQWVVFGFLALTVYRISKALQSWVVILTFLLVTLVNLCVTIWTLNRDSSTYLNKRKKHLFKQYFDACGINSRFKANLSQ